MVKISYGIIMQEKNFNLVLVHHQKGFQNHFFVNDPYDLDVSIKDSEHERQAGLSYVGQSRSVYMKKMMYFQI